MIKVIIFVNLLNLEENWFLKPKKEKNSKVTIYFLNSFINFIVDMLRIIFQGNFVTSKTTSWN